MRSTARLPLVLLAVVGLACSREGAGASLRSDSAALTLPEIGAPPAPYEPVELAQSGGIAGTVELDGPPPRPDSMPTVLTDRALCGRAALVPPVRLDGARLADVVVWLDDARTGKPLPLARRYEILNEHCLLRPRVQAALAGGTLNVRSLDATVHVTRFTRAASGDSLAVITENDEGQVVPVEEVLAAPAIVRATCDLHPWTRGWIAVFDHPYFAVSARDGWFSIDSIPPGRYKVMAWHERLGVLEDSITVLPDQHTEVRFRFRGAGH